MTNHLDLGQIYVDRLGFLMRWSTILASSLTKRDIFERLARAAVPYLADWCSIVALDGRGSFSRVGVAHADPEIDRLMRQLDPWACLPSRKATIGIPHTIRTGKSQLLKEVDVSQLLRNLGVEAPDSELKTRLLRTGVRSMMTVPLMAHGEVLGAMSLYNGPARPRFDPADLSLAEELSRRAALTMFTLVRLEDVSQERELLESVMVLYRNFVVSCVEDARTPLTAGRLKIEILARRPAGLEGDRMLLERVLIDIDRAVATITALVNEGLFENLLGEARNMSTKKAA